ncbi:MAG TPA: glycosyltransferase family 2 protein [Acidimicrobiia bacterium]|nr:glycosyltransferase family 2 protein [Acidimicrobiia bacterium]
MADADERLSLVVPFWNEEDTIDSMLDIARTVLDGLVAEHAICGYEIVCVDDASTDTTGKLLDARAASDPRLRVVHHERNRGLGGAVRSGLGATTGDVVLYTDADLPFDLQETGRLLRILRTYHADLVSGYRLDRRSEGFRRTLYSAAYNLLIRFSLGLRVRDVNFACKLLRRQVLDAITLESEGSFIDAELMSRADRMGFSIVQIGLDYFARSRGVSTLSSWGTIAGILREWRAFSPDIRKLGPPGIGTSR